ncbi:MAG: methylated-DNA--[protein]-cysteine S-methyltransferase [Bacteroidota bacterium]|nr:methylated-DNA--[protein]-cysteine S-methyltransferase [Bacteroidota bacterium]MDE2957444.1 methylated-DNA--[protein]-cysteine S-methyltransferase [Bacteroidota bacterium]
MGDLDFFRRVWETVALIPHGRVTTYGHIAEFLGSRSAARTVGWALRASKGTRLPCHRVVNRYGALTGKRQFGEPHLMELLLRSEGVTFDAEGCVDLSRHLWVPGEALNPATSD